VKRDAHHCKNQLCDPHASRRITESFTAAARPKRVMLPSRAYASHVSACPSNSATCTCPILSRPSRATQ
jgi:hypothetical protein